MMNSENRGWIIASLSLLAFVVVPFVLFGVSIEQFAVNSIDPSRYDGTIAGIVFAALALDVFLPVPSSMIGALAGATLGAITGALTVWAGLTIGGLAGYLAGRHLARPLLDRLVGHVAQAKAYDRVSHHGILYVALFRPVPVLSEASVIASGALNLPFRQVMLAVAVANVPVAVIYATIGSWAASWGVFWPAFGSVAFTVLIGWLASMVFGRFSKKG